MKCRLIIEGIDRRTAADSPATRRAMAQRFGVSLTTVNKIMDGTWKGRRP